MIKFDLHGRELALDEAVVQKLQAEALAKAGSSTTLNDLAVILTRALSERKTITLRRAPPLAGASRPAARSPARAPAAPSLARSRAPPRAGDGRPGRPRARRPDGRRFV